MSRFSFPSISGQGDRGTFERIAASIEPTWIEEALAATGMATLRRRRLPAEQVVWLVVGMALMRDLPIPEVVRELELALPDKKGGQRFARSSVIQARGRLGIAPLHWLFERTGRKWAHEDAERRKWRGLLLYSVDGSSVRVPDSDDNARHFGKRGNERGPAGYPLLRLVTLMATRSHLLADAELGPYEGKSEFALGSALLERVPAGSLLTVDRGYFFSELLIPLEQRECHWLTRGRKNTAYEVIEELGQDQWLVEMKVTHEARQRNPSLPKTWRARAIRYCRPGFRPQMLFTSLVDATAYPAGEIVALYHERWEIELGYDEVKTELLEREEAIRSRGPEGVYQETWGILLAYNLVRLEMTRIAEEAGVAPSRISFAASLRYVRKILRSLAFTSPGAIPARLRTWRSDPSFFVLPPRRPERQYPRAVKIKMSHYARNRGQKALPAK